jgi:Fic family protein
MIHPFDDGNRMIAREITNMVLLRSESSRRRAQHQLLAYLAERDHPVSS